MAGEVFHLPQDRRRLSRDESTSIRLKYELEQSGRELDAIRANRNARLRATRQAWMRKVWLAGLTALAGGFTMGLTMSSKPWVKESASSVLLHATPAPQPDSPPVALVSATTPVSAASGAKQASLNDHKVTASPAATPRAMPKSVIAKAPSQEKVGMTRVPLTAVPDNRNASYAQPPTAQVNRPNVPAAGVYEARPGDVALSEVKPAALPPVVAKVDSPSYVVVGVPADGVVMVQIGKDPTLKYVKTGQALPDGSRLGKASAETGKFELQRE